LGAGGGAGRELTLLNNCVTQPPSCQGLLIHHAYTMWKSTLDFQLVYFSVLV
jgi:hypothetical protein